MKFINRVALLALTAGLTACGGQGADNAALSSGNVVSQPKTSTNVIVNEPENAVAASTTNEARPAPPREAPARPATRTTSRPERPATEPTPSPSPPEKADCAPEHRAAGHC